MLRVGLTGGIACGKSTVLRRLAESGLATLDLDRIAHEVMAPGRPAHQEVRAAFGPRVVAPDGSIDRGALGAVVFADAEARDRLNAIVHPRVRVEEAARAARLEAEGHAVVVSDAALLVETGVHLRFDRLVVVHCRPQVQRRRLMERDGLSEPAAQARIDVQMPIGEKRRYAHLEVDTGDTPDRTDEASRVLAETLRQIALTSPPRVTVEPPRALDALVHGGDRGPRGLDGRTLLESASAHGGIELQPLARRLHPPWRGPWYEASRSPATSPWPEALAVPLALWAAAANEDEEWLLGAAASVARLTHDDPPSVAGACLAAWAASEILRGADLEGLEGRLASADGRVRRWGGAAPASRVREAIAAAACHPSDPRGARALASAGGAEVSFAGALVGAAGGAPAADAPDSTVVALVADLFGGRRKKTRD